MPPPFMKLTRAEFANVLQQFPFTRQISSIHMHHTWVPDRAQYKGHDSIVAMWRFHTLTNAGVTLSTTSRPIPLFNGEDKWPGRKLCS